MDGSLLSSSRGSPERLRRVGTDGPKISVSRRPVLIPRRAKERARLTGRSINQHYALCTMQEDASLNSRPTCNC